jgi:arylsulfatase A-like enzyme
MRADLPTLAERFAEAGYRTVALVVNQWLHPDLGLLRGFEVARQLASDGAMIRAAGDAIRAPDPRPLFLFVNAMSAHSPFREGPGPWRLPDPSFLDPARAPAWVRPYLTTEPPGGVQLAAVAAGDTLPGTARHAAGELEMPEQGLANLVRLYDAGVRGADFTLGRVLEAWISTRPESIVAVTSDHGEGFGEHGLLDHRIAVYPEMLRVPLVVVAPGRLPAGARVLAPVSMQRLHPTLIELAGIGSPRGSLVGLATGEGGEVGPIFAAARPDLWGQRAGGRLAQRWHLYRDGGLALVWSPDVAAGAELYSLDADPGMLRDLSATQPEQVAALRADAERAFAARGEVRGEPLQVPTHVAERLRELGYAE